MCRPPDLGRPAGNRFTLRLTKEDSPYLQVADSLAALVRGWITALRGGHYVRDEDRGVVHRLAALPPELLSLPGLDPHWQR